MTVEDGDHHQKRQMLSATPGANHCPGGLALQANGGKNNNSNRRSEQLALQRQLEQPSGLMRKRSLRPFLPYHLRTPLEQHLQEMSPEQGMAWLPHRSVQTLSTFFRTNPPRRLLPPLLHSSSKHHKMQHLQFSRSSKAHLSKAHQQDCSSSRLHQQGSTSRQQSSPQLHSRPLQLGFSSRSLLQQAPPARPSSGWYAPRHKWSLPN